MGHGEWEGGEVEPPKIEGWLRGCVHQLVPCCLSRMESEKLLLKQREVEGASLGFSRDAFVGLLPRKNVSYGCISTA